MELTWNNNEEVYGISKKLEAFLNPSGKFGEFQGVFKKIRTLRKFQALHVINANQGITDLIYRFEFSWAPLSKTAMKQATQ